MKNETENKRVIGYIRVSTEDQAKEGFSLDAQRRRIAGYCAANQLDLVGIESDEGISAKNIDRRPGVLRVIDMAKRKEIGGVVIVKLDRMFRSTVDALNTATMLDKKGVALHSITETLNTKSAMGRFFFTLLAGLATMEREVVSERTIAGLEERRAQGYKLGGQTPYGWAQDDGGKLIANEKEQNVLDYIMKMRTDKCSTRYISDRLNALGYTNRCGSRWNNVNVNNILHGVEKYGRPERPEHLRLEIVV